MSKPAEITLTLEPALQEFVRTAAAEGEFASSSDYVHDVLQKKFDEHRRNRLEQALDRGLADIEAGRFLPLDEAFEEIRNRLKKPDA